ncbi:MAG: LPP20 family lipoprotein [Nitrospirae bacterium]|nr:LPP20 family lipoprotein [Nitrospirota bacterium]
MNLNKYLLLFSLVFLSFQTSCAVRTAVSALNPDWTDGRSSKYPSELYLTGVGYGDDRKAAEDSAFAAIARMFQAGIQSKTSEMEQYTQTVVRGKTHVSRDIKIDQITSVATNKTLEDISIAEVWEDESENRIYALAVMDRRHAMTAIKEKIAAIDGDIEIMQQKSADISDKIKKAGTLRAILKSLLDREVYNTDLRIINPSGTGLEPPATPLDVKQQLQKILTDEIRIGVQVEGPHSDDIRSSIIEGLTGEGFSVDEAGGADKPDILVRGVVSFENADIPQWKFVRWNITIDLINQSDSRIFGSITRHGREGHMNFKEAEDKAVRALQEDINNELGRQLISSVYGGD